MFSLKNLTHKGLKSKEAEMNFLMLCPKSMTPYTALQDHNEQSGTKPKLVAKILVTNFNVLFVINVTFSKLFDMGLDTVHEKLFWIIRHFEKIIRHFSLSNMSIDEKFFRWSDNIRYVW